MKSKLIRKTKKILKDCEPKRFEPGRGKNSAERCRRKGFPNYKVLTKNKIGCNNAAKEEGALHENLFDRPNYEGHKGGGSCPKENKQDVYLCLDP